MRLAIVSTLIFGLLGGFLGGLVSASLFGEAQARNGPPAVPHEAEITLLAKDWTIPPEKLATDFGPTNQIVGVDPSNYPPGTQFILSVSVLREGSGRHCFRLADVTAPSKNPPPVLGSEVCTSANELYKDLESGPLTLLPGPRVYVLEVNQQDTKGDEVTVSVIRIIARWQEGPGNAPGS
ncbi:MAG TPA: hypothetical protein VFT91_06105 [Dehalococcoidia bacterium]|nr:hypothetical protein [Dehalococcoidia bacterium]